MAILESGRKNIVVLGAGFGGITALLKLRQLAAGKKLFPRYNLVLVNKSGQHLYTPALYEIASIPKGEANATCLKSSICIQVEDIIGRFRHIRFIGEEVVNLDPRTHIITFKSGDQLNFEYVIIALGSETNFFNVPGLAERALPIKTFEDAVRLRNVTEELLHGDKSVVRVLVGGGGPTGVEVAAEAASFFCRSNGINSDKRCPHEEITIVESSPEILQGFTKGIISRTKKRLKKLGVKIVSGSPIAGVAEEVSLKSGRVLPYDLLIWAGGVKPPAVLKNFGLPLDGRGGLAADSFLEVKPHIYAIGDCINFINPRTGKPLPKNVPVAESQARLAAKNVIAGISSRTRQKFVPAVSYPYILAVGGKYAVTDLVIVKFFGFLGWALKQIVELRYLLFILPWPKAVRMWLRTIYYSTRND